MVMSPAAKKGAKKIIKTSGVLILLQISVDTFCGPTYKIHSESGHDRW